MNPPLSKIKEYRRYGTEIDKQLNIYEFIMDDHIINTFIGSLYLLMMKPMSGFLAADKIQLRNY